MDLLPVEFPCFLPEDESCRTYSGYIQVQDVEFRLRVEMTPNERGNLSSTKIECDWPLQQLLSRVEPTVQQRLASSTTLYEFLVELREVVERLLQTQPRRDDLQCDYYQRLMGDLEAVGWSHVTHVDSSLTLLQFEVRDGRDRPHAFTLRMTAEYPHTAPVCTCSLPVAFNLRWAPGSALIDVLTQFKEALTRFQDLWDMLDEIDVQTWVLEPENPTRNITLRRIAVGKNSTLHIELDPLNPRMLPECRFMGADGAVAPLRHRLSANIMKWDPQRTVLANIKALLETELPSPSTSKKEEFSAECGICYAYRLGESVPDKSCEDPRCRQQFHHECLVEWLRSVPTSRQSFNILFGECPYCSKPLTVKTTFK